MSSSPKRADRVHVCAHCKSEFSVRAPGTRHRNHCPYCLWSVHLDRVPGDRAARCGGLMEPIGIEVRRGGEWALIHRCTSCGTIKTNRIAGDDDESALLRLALRPIAQLPFPLELPPGRGSPGDG
ncbi:MAG: RNHCP domain-containing protein [Planctomycetota bacterium]